MIKARHDNRINFEYISFDISCYCVYIIIRMLWLTRCRCRRVGNILGLSYGEDSYEVKSTDIVFYLLG